MRVGILTGKGRAFCAGADLKGELAQQTPQNIASITKAQTPIRNPQSQKPDPNTSIHPLNTTNPRP